jgi:integrase/recombinase XerD
MKLTDFSRYITCFLSEYLPAQKNVSRNTIKFYRELLLLFCEEDGSPAEKITMQKLSADLMVSKPSWRSQIKVLQKVGVT